MARGSLLDTLSKAVRAALPYFQAASNTELSSSQIVTQARAAGYSFKTQTAYDVIALFRDNQSTGQYLRSIAASEIPDPNKFATPIGKLLRNYRYVVDITGRAIDGEFINHKNITVSTDQLLTKEQVLEQATTAILKGENYKAMNIDSATVIDAYSNE